MMRYWLAALAVVAVPAAAQVPPSLPAPTPARPGQVAKIVLVGDSTVQPRSGWGAAFCADHVKPTVACINLGRGGRSSKSFRVEGLWDAAVAEMKAPGFKQTYVLIGFGHNDSSNRPERHTDIVTEFPANMTRYVADIRAAGATPVLFTPVTQRSFKGGQLQRDLEPWAAAIRKVGAETNTPVIDLYRMSGDAVQAMGPVAALRFAQAPAPAEVQAAAATGTTIPAPAPTPPAAAPATTPPTQPDSARPPVAAARTSFDYTHLGPEGATYFSKMVTDDLMKTVPRMRPLLIP